MKVKEILKNMPEVEKNTIGVANKKLLAMEKKPAMVFAKTDIKVFFQHLANVGQYFE
jgi:hypothetical protein